MWVNVEMYVVWSLSFPFFSCFWMWSQFHSGKNTVAEVGPRSNSRGVQADRWGDRCTEPRKNHRDFLPHAEACADGDEVLWKVNIYMNSGARGVKQNYCHFSPLLCLACTTALLYSKTATANQAGESFWDSQEETKEEHVCAELLGFHPVTHGCPARVSHLRQIATHVRLTHAQEAIHKFSVQPL